ncbi:MAG TPA: hypothetical protein PKD72_13860, partial [Gemmatales bacterium]|nr:hypothetical protein [Gemmatales bacterium]
MFGIDYVLAAMLLSGADLPGWQNPKSQPGWHALLAKPIVFLTLHCELLDQRELRYVLVKPEEFISDVRMLQRRAHDLQNAPYLGDAVRFPERVIVNELLLQNRSYRQYLDQSLPLYPHSTELRQAKEEIEVLYQIWDSVRDARCEYYYVHIRRQALKRLHDMLG